MKIFVKFDLDLPDAANTATQDQIDRWLRFNLNDTGMLTCDFALADEPLPGPILDSLRWGVLP